MANNAGDRPMNREPTYTFKFGVRGRTVREDHITRKQVPYSELLNRFDQAYDWVMANPEKRYAEVYGPGMKTRVVTHTAREYILKQLPDEIPKQKTVVALLWMDLSDHRDYARDYRLYKLWKATVPLPDLPQQPETHYGYTEVDVEDWDRAFEWAHVNRWHDYGVWINRKPALIFTPIYDAAKEAFLGCAVLLQYLPQRELLRAPVRHEWKQREMPYPRMATKRSRPKIQQLRHRFPTAGDDMMVAPLEYLIWKHGYGLAR
jgi:hypothetical protein